MKEYKNYSVFGKLIQEKSDNILGQIGILLEYNLIKKKNKKLLLTEEGIQFIKNQFPQIEKSLDKKLLSIPQQETKKILHIEHHEPYKLSNLSTINTQNNLNK